MRIYYRFVELARGHAQSTGTGVKEKNSADADGYTRRKDAEAEDYGSKSQTTVQAGRCDRQSRAHRMLPTCLHVLRGDEAFTVPLPRG